MKQTLIKLHWLLSSQFGLDPRALMRSLSGRFPKYLHEYHLAKSGFHIETLTANGDW